MGISIDLEKVNYNQFINKLMETQKIYDRELLEKIILEFGNHIGEDLVILHNEYYEDGICTWNMCSMINKVFRLDEETEDAYEIYSDLSKYLTSYKEKEEAYENLGLNYEDYENDDEV